MITSIIIIIFSLALFLYWFRATCLLLLAQQGDVHALRVASTIRLTFITVQEELKTQRETQALDRLHKSLEHDYEVLTELLRHAQTPSVEKRILAVDFKIMQLAYKLTRTRHILQARTALSEMACIMSYFAAEIGQDASASA